MSSFKFLSKNLFVFLLMLSNLNFIISLFTNFVINKNELSEKKMKTLALSPTGS
jgi:hypothetical protein